MPEPDPAQDLPNLSASVADSADADESVNAGSESPADAAGSALSGSDRSAKTPVSTPPPLHVHFDRLSRKARLVLVGVSVFLLAGFGLAGWLEPDSRGFGTHQRLGLPPCSMRVMFGIPCPNCGMTTSFAHFVRGEIGASLRANAAGTVLAVVCALLVPWCLLSSLYGRFLGVTDPAHALVIGLVSLAGVTLLHWSHRLWTG